MAVLKREYEISVWHEKLNEKGNKLEEKMAVIGAHDMTYLGRATNVHFLTKMNGTHLLTFLLPDKYFDSEKGDFVLNEFKDYLLNESKVKLKYKDEWYEFYIKTVKDTKHYKSYMKNYTCTDAYIDELSRNGYGITFDTELYNNVEEIGIFTDEILEGSLWEYSPENNWGDFTEYTEEKLFKISISLFGGTVSGYKLNFDTNSTKTINNVYTKEKRYLLLGDDLAGREGYFWDCYFDDYKVDWDEVENISNDGYIYIPYSQLDFCYITNLINSSNNFLPATESPYTADDGKYLIAPPSINPKALIQFIAIPNGAEIEVDEAGLIVNKDYTYVMTVEDWNKAVNTDYWYTKDMTPDGNGDFKKEVIRQEPDCLWFYNKGVTYDGYLDNIGSLAVENGKRISITDRTEVNISKEIDLYVKVYLQKSEDFDTLYEDPENWLINGLSRHEGFRVCSATRTRQIIPQLARNYFENAVNIKSVNGWEVLHLENIGPQSNKKNTTIEFYYERDNASASTHKPAGELLVTIGNIDDSKNRTIINFGAVGQKKTIKANKVYCFGIITNSELSSGTKFIIGKGSAGGNDTDYTIDSDIKAEFNLQGLTELFYFVRFNKEIENPYLCLYFGGATENTEIRIKEVWFFEAYTKGQDLFDNVSFKYSGRDYIWNYDLNDNISDRIEREELENKILFETDIMRGDTYGYLEYFILLLVPKDKNYGIDTFKAKEYISEDAEIKDKYNSLPLPASEFTDDDYEIITNYIDMNKCPNYVGNTNITACDCKYDSDSANKFCMYLKYGYCPYMFTTEKHCRKIRTLTGSKSNRFNLTLELGKIFEVYPQYYIEHTPNGNIKVDENGKAIKKVFYITEKGVENKIGFRYEKNLSNIDRTIVSDKIVTKLYVLDVDSTLSRTGLCSIKTAEDNPSKDSFIIDLSYYIKQGMLDKELTIADLYGIDNTKLGFLKQLGNLNTQYDMLTNKIISLLNESFNELQSKVEVGITGYETVLKEIAKITKLLNRYGTNEEDKNNDAYKNYAEKLALQETRKSSILMELINSTTTDKTVEELREDYLKNHTIEVGLLGQFNEEYDSILKWKKKKAEYLKDINNLTKEFYSIYEPYLKEGTWSNNNYLTDNAYYHDALGVAAEGAIPKVTYSIKVVPLGILDENYEIGIADTTYIEDIGMFGINKKTGLPNKLKVIISLLDESLDKPSEDSITIQNFTTLFEDLFLLVTASVLSLTYNENIYKRSSNFTSNQNVKTESLQGTLDGNNLTLLDTAENNIVLDANGLSGSDISNHNNKYDLNGLGLFFSKNGGQTWDIGVGPEGINADYINTGTLDAGNIRIVDNDYVYFLWDKSGITAYREPLTNSGSIFGLDYARFNKYGLSLVKKNKIRLRAGYEFSGTDGNVNTEGNVGEDIGFYLYDEKGQPIFLTETGEGKSARLSLKGEIQTYNTDNGIAIYINNLAGNSSVTGYYKRLLSIVKTSDNTEYLKNILSVLDNGSLYIGGRIKGNESSTIDTLSDYVKMDYTNPTVLSNTIELTSDGEIKLGGENILTAVERLINELIVEVRNIGLIKHAHFIDYSSYGNTSWTNKTAIQVSKSWDPSLPEPVGWTTELTQTTRSEIPLDKMLVAVSTNTQDDLINGPGQKGTIISLVPLSTIINNLPNQTQYAGTAEGPDQGGGGEQSPSSNIIVAYGPELGDSSYEAHVENSLYILDGLIILAPVQETWWTTLTNYKTNWRFDSQYNGQCVGWVKNRLYSYCYEKYGASSVFIPLPYSTGGGGAIATDLFYMGVLATRTPTKDSIFSYTNSNWGHTGWVEYVGSNGIITSEFNASLNGEFSLRFHQKGTYNHWWFVDGDAICRKNKN